jgi:hypothetical protein
MPFMSPASLPGSTSSSILTDLIMQLASVKKKSFFSRRYTPIYADEIRPEDPALQGVTQVSFATLGTFLQVIVFTLHFWNIPLRCVTQVAPGHQRSIEIVPVISML